MGVELRDVLESCPFFGQTIHHSGRSRTGDIELESKMPTSGVLVSYSPGGRTKQDHEAELERQKQILLEGENVALKLRSDITYVGGKPDMPEIALETYLIYQIKRGRK